MARAARLYAITARNAPLRAARCYLALSACLNVVLLDQHHQCIGAARRHAKRHQRRMAYRSSNRAPYAPYARAGVASTINRHMRLICAASSRMLTPFNILTRM